MKYRKDDSPEESAKRRRALERAALRVLLEGPAAVSEVATVLRCPVKEVIELLEFFRSSGRADIVWKVRLRNSIANFEPVYALVEQVQAFLDIDTQYRKAKPAAASVVWSREELGPAPLNYRAC